MEHLSFISCVFWSLRDGTTDYSLKSKARVFRGDLTAERQLEIHMSNLRYDEVKDGCEFARLDRMCWHRSDLSIVEMMTRCKPEDLRLNKAWYAFMQKRTMSALDVLERELLEIPSLSTERVYSIVHKALNEVKRNG